MMSVESLRPSKSSQVFFTLFGPLDLISCFQNGSKSFGNEDVRRTISGVECLGSGRALSLATFGRRGPFFVSFLVASHISHSSK